jgi:hypothetical protein
MIRQLWLTPMPTMEAPAMQLDHTHVKVRLRTMAEIGDLALIMVRRYPSALLIGFVAGAFLWALADLFVLGCIPIMESGYGLDDEEAMVEIFRYLAWMGLLVMLQAPAAGVLSTLYLGLAVFEQRPTWSAVRDEAKRQFKRWFWKLGIVRFALPPVVLLALRWGQPASGFWDVFVPIVILLWVSIVRAASPFMPEILLLEQCPIRSVSKDTITASRRSRSLHRPLAGDLSGRFIAVSCILVILLFSIGYSLVWVRGISIGRWDLLNLFVLLVIYPVALWSVAGISIIVRLLNYLDCRIRLEGWEVELAVRAEAMRQFGDDIATTQADTEVVTAVGTAT